MNTFINTHLCIDKEDHSPSPAVGFSIHEVTPTLDLYKPLLKSVGGPWGWDRRPKYYGDDALSERLKGSRLFLLQHYNDTVGYSLTKPVESLTLAFRGQKVIEIENFGLLPEHNGKGYGKPLLKGIFDELFKEADTVYLSTRSTNHPKVLPFYEGAGMRVLGSEVLPDDLIPDTKPVYSQPMLKIA